MPPLQPQLSRGGSRGFTTRRTSPDVFRSAPSTCSPPCMITRHRIGTLSLSRLCTRERLSEQGARSAKHSTIRVQVQRVRGCTRGLSSPVPRHVIHGALESLDQTSATRQEIVGASRGDEHHGDVLLRSRRRGADSFIDRRAGCQLVFLFTPAAAVWRASREAEAGHREDARQRRREPSPEQFPTVGRDAADARRRRPLPRCHRFLPRRKARISFFYRLSKNRSMI